MTRLRQGSDGQGPQIGTVVLLERARRRRRLQAGLVAERPVIVTLDAGGGIMGLTLNGEALAFVIEETAVTPPPRRPRWRRRLERAWRRMRAQWRFLGVACGRAVHYRPAPRRWATNPEHPA